MFRKRSASTGHRAPATGSGSRHDAPGFLHVIATRHGIGVFDEDWFEYRQHLLEHLTLASIDAQTAKGFTWLIGVDRDMPPRARKALDRMLEGRPYARVLEVELKRDFKRAVAEWIKEESEARGLDWAMSTRLDDDDAIHRDLVSRLHAEAEAFLLRHERRSAVFAPVTGYNWVPAERAGHRAFHPSPSMGLTLFEPVGEARSVYDWNHMKLQEKLAPEGAYLGSLDSDVLWWLYAHTNLSDQQREGSGRRTRAYSHPRAFRLDDEALGRFGISPDGAEFLQRIPEPEPVDSTHYLTKRGAEVEKEIHVLRGQLRRQRRSGDSEAAALVRERIAELHAVRREMHRHIVRRMGDKTDML
ncbi:glycosyltransferase [Glycomyces arizonensis]|uniref:glycosyltransferase n=1 Tax=Glycomyces arizonensis TaxID=256035 RepID=UPI000405818B|nr:glycosyltransferase [Glycomyces arizonensis]